ncbi:hypothetical protein [Caviibacterium pharyngocola]|uniref:SH3b domain-containing protein n=1 Tax=Caviibacterium pharyngocola TaxID=28159 RepID=A0A2M8RZ09_9PAST|nr:hypothetical protein [Caviibacterium pharyngocola]PJG84116.1 hypothetical protein CVP04_01295 [Caviibacterium pharyngocola]
MKKIILSILFLFISVNTFADSLGVKYIGTNSAAVREYATQESPVIERITYGKKVYVYGILNDWSRLTEVNQAKQRWVRSNELCDTPNCRIKNNTITTKTKKSTVYPQKTTKSLKSSTSHSVKKSRVKSQYTSSCSCGYGYCYGPRGGRYCITSGGNKSYR